MSYALKVIERPDIGPVSLEDMKVHLRVDHDDEDTLIESLTMAAGQWVEQRTGRTLVETTLEVSFDSYPCGVYLELPGPPIIDVVSFAHTDSDGESQTIAEDQYVLDASSDLVSRLIPAYNVSWPATRYQPSSLRVRYRAGYARAGSPDERDLIPASLLAAVKLLVGHLYKNREAVTSERQITEVPMTVEALCAPNSVNLGL